MFGMACGILIDKECLERKTVISEHSTLFYLSFGYIKRSFMVFSQNQSLFLHRDFFLV